MKIMNHVKVGSAWASRNLYRDKHDRYLRTGIEDGEIEISVDVEALVKALGYKALKSKTGTSKLQQGAVVARVVKRQTRRETNS